MHVASEVLARGAGRNDITWCLELAAMPLLPRGWGVFHQHKIATAGKFHELSGFPHRPALLATSIR